MSLHGNASFKQPQNCMLFSAGLAHRIDTGICDNRTVLAFKVAFVAS